MSQVTFINVQTTGVGKKGEPPHYAVEVSAEVFIDGKYDAKKSFTQLLNPGRDITAEATKLHGHTNASLQNKPGFDKVSGPLAKLIAESNHLVMHCSFFVKPILKSEYERLGLEIDFKAPIFDTFHQAYPYFGKDAFPQGRGLECMYDKFANPTMAETREGPFHAEKKVVKLSALVTGMVSNLVESGQYDKLKKSGKIKPEHEALFKALHLETAKPKVVRQVSFSTDIPKPRPKRVSELLRESDEKHPKGMNAAKLMEQCGFHRQGPMTRALKKQLETQEQQQLSSASIVSK